MNSTYNITDITVKPERNLVGLINSELILKNPSIPEINPIEVNALADTGAVQL